MVTQQQPTIEEQNYTIPTVWDLQESYSFFPVLAVVPTFQQFLNILIESYSLKAEVRL